MIVYLSLGCNRGDCARTLDAAIAALPRFGVRVRRASAHWATEPEGATGRRGYRNCAVEGETALLPRVLLRRLLALERALGRRRQGRVRRKTPRTLDMDLIFFGRQRVRMPGLTIPHPRFAARRFVLGPLAEIAPHYHPPGSARNAKQLFRRL